MSRVLCSCGGERTFTTDRLVGYSIEVCDRCGVRPLTAAHGDLREKRTRAQKVRAYDSRRDPLNLPTPVNSRTGKGLKCGHPETPENVYEYHNRSLNRIQRQCRICRKIRSQRNLGRVA